MVWLFGWKDVEYNWIVGSGRDLDIGDLVMESLTVSIFKILFTPCCRGVTFLFGTGFLFRMYHYHRNEGFLLFWPLFLLILCSLYCDFASKGLYIISIRLPKSFRIWKAWRYIDRAKIVSCRLLMVTHLTVITSIASYASCDLDRSGYISHWFICRV